MSARKNEAEVRLRLHRGQQGPEGPARRQGRQPRRDDQPRAAGAARASPSPPRPARPTSTAGSEPAELRDEVERAPRRARAARWASKLGQSDDPLLVSVRSGAKFSMPGMMETVLNIGLNDAVGARPGRAGRRRAVRLGLLPPADPDVRQDRARHRRRALRGGAGRGQARQGHRRATSTWTRPTCAQLVETFKDDRRRARRAGRSRRSRASRWTWPSARSSTRGTPTGPMHLPPPGAHPGRPGHRGQHLLDGVRQPRPGLRHRRRLHPRPGHRRTRASTATTCRTRRARTSSPASATPCRSPTSEQIDKTSYDELMEIMQTLETHYRDLCDIEFTIERGKLWMLQTRVGKRTAAAAFRIATQLVDQGLIDMDEALQRVTGAQLAQLMFPRFDDRRRRSSRIAPGHERLARRRRRQGGLRLLHRGQVVALAASRSSWSAARPTPTTSTA